jgi:hypothetical protein
MVSHDDCAGNPVTREEHEHQLWQCLAKIRSWGLSVKRVLGAWIDEEWKIEIIEASG